jgi:hypothetical protein
MLKLVVRSELKPHWLKCRPGSSPGAPTIFNADMMKLARTYRT